MFHLDVGYSDYCEVVVICRRLISEKTVCKVETFQSVELHVMAFLADKCVNLLRISFNLITQLIILNIQQTEYSGGGQGRRVLIVIV